MGTVATGMVAGEGAFLSGEGTREEVKIQRKLGSLRKLTEGCFKKTMCGGV